MSNLPITSAIINSKHRILAIINFFLAILSTVVSLSLWQ